MLPSSLFDPLTQSLRKTDKSSLGRTLDDMTNSASCPVPETTFYVLDGGAIVHKIPWPRTGTFGDVLETYRNHVSRHYGVATII